MGIKRVTTNREINSQVSGFIDAQLKELVNRMILLGDYCYQEAINRITYTHRTGNLGSSTGYIVLNNGIKVGEGGFLSIHGPDRTDTAVDGTEIGRGYADSLIPEYSRGIVLIFVAGMKYAGFVEAKGYNVITSAELWVQQNALRILSSVGL